VYPVHKTLITARPTSSAERCRLVNPRGLSHIAAHSDAAMPFVLPARPLPHVAPGSRWVLDGVTTGSRGSRLAAAVVPQRQHLRAGGGGVASGCGICASRGAWKQAARLVRQRAPPAALPPERDSGSRDELDTVTRKWGLEAGLQPPSHPHLT